MMNKNIANRLKTFHGWATIQWTLHIPVIIFIYIVFPEVWEKMSILYLALVSIYANIVGHFGAWQASRGEVATEANLFTKIKDKLL